LGELECHSCGHSIPPGAPDAAAAGPGASGQAGAFEPPQGARGYQASNGSAGAKAAASDHGKRVFFMVFVLFLIYSIITAAISFPAIARLDMINHRTPMHQAATGLLMIFVIVIYAILAALAYWALFSRQLWTKWGCLILTIVFLVGSIGRLTSSFFTWVLIDAPGESLPGVLRFILAISVLGQLCLELWFVSLLYYDTKRQA
jgi:hypothetical protein